MAKKQKENEIYLVRYYDAPLSAVWNAWVDPEQAKHWWGPRGFTITTHSKDLRIGGHWNYTMHGSDGVDYPNVTTYFEVEKEAKLVYDHGANENQPALFRVTVLFSREKDKTKMELTMAFSDKEAAEKTATFIKAAGGNATWDRLAEYVEKEQSNKEIFIINRSFDAPIDVVFDAWSNPKKLVKWLSPKGSNMEFIEADIRSNGKSFYKMGNDQFTMYGRASYIKVERPHTLIYSQQFCDKDGNISRHPLAPTWPETMLTHVNFVETEDGKTLVTIRWEVFGDVTLEEIQTFINGRTSMTGGWTGSLDKLEELFCAL